MFNARNIQRVLLWSYILLLIEGCIADRKETPRRIRVDFICGYKFISLIVGAGDSVYAVRGVAYGGQVKAVESSDTSNFFKLDSMGVFVRKISELKDSPYIKDDKFGIAKANIYIGGVLVYSSFKWKENFWDIFNDINGAIPKEYDPFIGKDNFLTNQ